MCRLFGFRSAVPSRAHRSLVSAQNALITQADTHPDGWGIGWFDGDDAYVVRTARAAFDCGRFRRVSEGLQSHTFLAHVRRATVGEPDSLNSHPFRHGRWLFAHNGTLFGTDEGMREWMLDRTAPRLRPHVLGETDSEALFLYLLSELERAGLDPSGRIPSRAHAVAQRVRDALQALDQAHREGGFERPLTNVLLTDGRLFLAHRAGMPLHMSTQKHHCADAPVCPAVKVCLEARRPRGQPVNHLIAASEPIAGDENVWEEVADGATVVLDGDFGLEVLPPPRGWVAPILPERLRVATGSDPAR